MTENNLKSVIGAAIILANILIILAIFILYILGGFLFDEMTTSIALIAPMLSIYTTAIIRDIVKNKNRVKSKGKTVTGDYIFISFLFPLVFVLFLLSIVFAKGFNIGFSSFEQFKTMLAVSETAFGAYAGVVLSSFFKSD